MFAVIDLETTGGSYRYERIIEVAIVVHDGEKVIETFESLVNPEMLIPMHITRLTGISNDMVEKAPKFYEIAKKIVELTEDKVFVAHNVNFDFGFIRKEFSDLGFNFNRKKLCTVKYTRQVFPGLPSYSLGNLCEHFEIPNNARHRAMGDAMATSILLKKVLEKDKWNLFNKSLRTNDALTNMHPHLKKEHINKLPAAPGVYYFYDKSGNIIYIGKSVNIHQRIISHLNNDQSAKSLEMKNAIASIKYDLTGSDLLAQLLESDMIKKYKPFYNRVLKRDGFKYGIYTHLDTRSYLNFTIKKAVKHSDAVMTFNTQKQARNFISRLESLYGLCYQENNLSSNQQCLRYKSGECMGACLGLANADEYNAVFKAMLDDLLFESGSYIIELPGRKEKEMGFVYISDQKFKGYGFAPKNLDIENEEDFKPYLRESLSNYDNHLIVKAFSIHNEMVKIQL